ncbi:unnamed protein product [Sympodiomycopsis kandeliae]
MSNRFVLPDFNANFDGYTLPVEKLREFIADPFQPHAGDGFTEQLEAGVCIIFVLLCMASAVIWRRIKEKSFWLFRSDARQGGTFIVPNAVTTFVIIQYIYGTIWIAYAIYQILLTRGNASPVGLMLWISLIWLPLIQGAWFAGWGTFSVSPPQTRIADLGQTQRTTRDRIRCFLEWCIRHIDPARLSAPTVNMLMFIIPAIHLVIIVIFAALAENQWRPAVRHWKDFDAELADFIKTARAAFPATSQGQVTDELSAKALDVWHHAWKGTHIMRDVWWAWSVSAWAFTAIYSLCAASMLYRLIQEVRALRDGLHSAPSNKEVLNGSVKPSAQISKPIRPTLRVNNTQGAGLFTPDADKKSKGTDGTVLQTAFWPPVRSRAEVELPSGGSTEPSQPSSAGRRRKGRKSLQYVTLRKVTILVALQSIGISVAAAGFSVLAVALAIGFGNAIATHNFTKWFHGANLAACWLSCVFGSVIFSAITARTFDNLTYMAMAAARLGVPTIDHDEEARSGNVLREQLPQPLEPSVSPSSGALHSRNQKSGDTTVVASSASTMGTQKAGETAANKPSKLGGRLKIGGRRTSNPWGPFYSIQTIFQDDTVRPIEEDFDLVEIPRPVAVSPSASLVVSNGDHRDSTYATHTTTGSKSLWQSLHRHFVGTPTERHGERFPDAFEDDTLSPSDSISMNDKHGLSRPLARIGSSTHTRRIQESHEVDGSDDASPRYKRMNSTALQTALQHPSNQSIIIGGSDGEPSLNHGGGLEVCTDGDRAMQYGNIESSTSLRHLQQFQGPTAGQDRAAVAQQSSAMTIRPKAISFDDTVKNSPFPAQNTYISFGSSQAQDHYVPSSARDLEKGASEIARSFQSTSSQSLFQTPPQSPPLAMLRSPTTTTPTIATNIRDEQGGQTAREHPADLTPRGGIISHARSYSCAHPRYDANGAPAADSSYPHQEGNYNTAPSSSNAAARFAMPMSSAHQPVLANGMDQGFSAEALYIDGQRFMPLGGEDLRAGK